LYKARIPTVVYGTADPKAGACHTLYQITKRQRLNHRAIVLAEVLQEECCGDPAGFFVHQRSLGKK